MNVLLLDGYNLLYRAFASLPRTIVGRDGLPINAVYGALSAVIRLLRDPGADHAVLAMDTPETLTFRHTLLPAYQGQRGPLGGEHSEEFARQVTIATTVFPMLGIPAVASPGFEADDVMGSLAVAIAHGDSNGIVVSTDRDLLQLVRPHIEVLAPGPVPRIYRTDEDVRERLGVSPKGVTDWKALAGDQSDNVPGIKGIGPKTAASLVEQYGSLEGIFAARNQLPPRTATLLDGQETVALLYRDVVTIRTNLPLSITIATLPKPTIDADSAVRESLARVGFGRP